MNLSMQSKFKTPEILGRRIEMIEKEKLHIKDGISYERFLELYNKYGEGLEEKDFAYAFLDIDDVKYANISTGKHSQTAVLSKEYVSKEDFQAIRMQLIEGYGLNVVSYNKSLELYEKFGDRLSFKLFSEEILGIEEKRLKSKNMKRYPDKEIPINFDIEPGEYGSLNGTEEMPMYVLNPEYILGLRNKIIYEAGLHIEESINYEKFSELYQAYGKDMDEVVFAQEVLDISVRSLNRMKSPKKFSTMILQNVEIPQRYIMTLRDKIVLLNKLEGGQQLEYSKIKEFHRKYGREFTEKNFAVKVLEVTSENYRPDGENDSVTILNTRVTNYEVLRNKMIKEMNLHYDDMIDYEIFQKWHQRYAPNMPEVVFAEEILDISKSNFREVKDRKGHARILLNLKLPSKEEISEIRKKIIIENNFHIKDEIGYEELEKLHLMHGGIMSLEMFAVDVLLMSQTGFKVLKRDYEENKDNKAVKLKKAYVLLNYEIPLADIEELKKKIKKEENLENPRMMSKEEIERLYNQYGGIMPFNMFLRGILGVSRENFENLKYELHKETLVQIREKLNSNEIKELKRLLAQGLSENEIAMEMEVPLAFLRLSIKELSESKELSEANMLYERVKLLKDERKSLREISETLNISDEETKELLSRYKEEKDREAEEQREEKRRKRIQKKESDQMAKLEKKTMKILDEYKFIPENIRTVRSYIASCKRRFEEGQEKDKIFSEESLMFLSACMEFVVCDYQEIGLFAKICVAMKKYQLASNFILDNIANEGVTTEEQAVLRKVQENIKYAIKKEEALLLIEKGVKDIRLISDKTGVLETDVLAIKKSVDESRMFTSGGNRTDEDAIAI